MHEALAITRTFTENNLPDLDVVTLAALQLFSETSLPELPKNKFKRPLVVGSVNALAAGTMAFFDVNAVFADESTFERILARDDSIDGVFLISASGSKHAIKIAQTLRDKNIPCVLITNNPNAPAAAALPLENVVCFPKNREPYSYNTSTYLGMVLAATGESPSAILNTLTSVSPALATLNAVHTAYTFILPAESGPIGSMVRVKFDELFGPKLVGRAFTEEEVKHAKTIVGGSEEIFISIGVTNDHYGLEDRRINIPLPEGSQYGTVLATSYYVVGHIQRLHPPYFKKGIEAYVTQLSEVFNQVFSVIVE
jgi:hypothetical protein